MEGSNGESDLFDSGRCGYRSTRRWSNAGGAGRRRRLSTLVVLVVLVAVVLLLHALGGLVVFVVLVSQSRFVNRRVVFEVYPDGSFVELALLVGESLFEVLGVVEVLADGLLVELVLLLRQGLLEVTLGLEVGLGLLAMLEALSIFVEAAGRVGECLLHVFRVLFEILDCELLAVNVRRSVV